MRIFTKFYDMLQYRELLSLIEALRENISALEKEGETERAKVLQEKLHILYEKQTDMENNCEQL